MDRRETEVRLLSSRAGTPAWGPEILARTRFGFSAEDDGAVMGEFYLQWERWTADLSESHTNHPVLIRFRSPAKYSSWLVALVAVLDSAALWLALSPGQAPTPEARLALRRGFTTLRSIADTLGLPVDHDPDPDTPRQLTYDEYLEGVARISLHHVPHDPDTRGGVARLPRLAGRLRAARLCAGRSTRRRPEPRRHSARRVPVRRSGRRSSPAAGPAR